MSARVRTLLLLLALSALVATVAGLNCDPGNYLSPDGSACVQCPWNTYRNTSGATNVTQCLACQLGQGTNTMGAVECVPCHGGTYGVPAGGCVPCPVGTWSPQLSTGANTVCNQCPAGQTTASTGANSPSLCTCPPDTRAVTTVNGTTCACPAGTYGDSTGPTACSPCDVNTYRNATGATSAAQCLLCPLGQGTSFVGSTSCIPCAGGSHGFPTGGCVPCPVGTWSPWLTSGSNIVCNQCPSGQTTASASADSAAACTACPVGTRAVTAGDGSVTCVACPAGTCALSGSTSCTSCNVTRSNVTSVCAGTSSKTILGGSLSMMYEGGVTTTQQCSALCARYSGCTGWSTTANTDGWCALSTGNVSGLASAPTIVSAALVNSSCATGISPDQFPTTANGCSGKIGFQWIGTVLSATSVNQQADADVGSCATSCRLSDSCVAWQFGSNNPSCTLYSAVTGASPASGVTAGMKPTAGEICTTSCTSCNVTRSNVTSVCAGTSSKTILGGSLSMMYEGGVTTTQQCSALCARYSGCTGWSTTANTDGWCALSTGNVSGLASAPTIVSAALVNSSCATGISPDQFPTTANGCSGKIGFQWIGTVLSATSVNQQADADVGSCATSCRLSDSCVAWQFGSNNPSCTLYSAVTGASPASGVTAGMKPTAGEICTTSCTSCNVTRSNVTSVCAGTSSKTILGGSLSMMYEGGVTTTQQCSALCARYSGCTGWSTTANTDGWCALSTGNVSGLASAPTIVSAALVNSSCATGISPDQFPTTANGCSGKIGFQWIGTVLSATSVNQQADADVGSCATSCRLSDSCVAWQFGSNNPSCTLYSAVTGASPASGVTAGMKPTAGEICTTSCTSCNVTSTQSPVGSTYTYYTTSNRDLYVDAAAGLLSAAYDPQGRPLTAHFNSNFGYTSYGQVTVNTNGSFLYQPPSWMDWGTLVDFFWYTVNNGIKDSDRYVVVIHITYANSNTSSGAASSTSSPSTNSSDSFSSSGAASSSSSSGGDSGPSSGASSSSSTGSGVVSIVHAYSNFYTTSINTRLVVLVSQGLLLDNDVDEFGHSLTALLVFPTLHGRLALGGMGEFTYEPMQSFVGHDEFWYRTSNGEKNSTAAIVGIYVQDGVSNSSSSSGISGNSSLSNSSHPLTSNDTAKNPSLAGVTGTVSSATAASSRRVHFSLLGVIAACTSYFLLSALLYV